MTYGNFDESRLENKLKIVEQKIAVLEDAIEKSREIIKRHEKEVVEHREISLIINGLFAKAEALAKEDKTQSAKIPETDEEWDAWIARTQRIQNIYEMIANLSVDMEASEQRVQKINDEFDAIPKIDI